MKLTLIIAALTIFVIALLVIALRHFRQARSKVSTASLEPSLAFASDKPAANPPTREPFDAVRWAQMNEWLFKGQADDRRPRNGRVALSAGSASAHRSIARRTHQVNHKGWSQQRHD